MFEEISEVEAKKNSECLQQLDDFREIPYNQSLFEEIKKEEKPKEAVIELKDLPPHLKYVFLVGNSQKQSSSIQISLNKKKDW